MRGFDLKRRIPVRDPEREARSSASGPVKTYTLPPEEIEKIFAKGKPAPKESTLAPWPHQREGSKPKPDYSIKPKQPNKPGRKPAPEPISREGFLQLVASGRSIADIERGIGAKMNTLGYWVKKWDLVGINPGKARAMLAGEQHTEEDETMNLTREEYLQLRLSGQGRTEILKAHTKNTPKFYKQLAEWGIRSMADEEKALEELRGLREETLEPAAETSTAFERTPEGGFASTEPATPGIDWFTPEVAQRHEEPTVTINNSGFTFGSSTAKQLGLKPGELMEVGYAAGKLYFRRGSGFKLQRSGAAGARASSRNLPKWPHWSKIERKRYPVTVQDGLIVAEVGGDA